MFKKKGLILVSKKVNWGKLRLWVPTPYQLNRDKIIIYFSGQDKISKESDMGFFIFDIKKNKVIKISKKPVLTRGKTGSFDDSAIVPSQIIKFKNKFYLYYIGWTQGKKIPYMPSIGLACSKSLMGPFKKYSLGPIADKSPEDPFFVSSCFLDKKDNKTFEVYYTSSLGWYFNGKSFVPKYHIKKSFSKDGINWNRNKRVELGLKNNFEKAITRPWIIKINKKKYMFYSYKNKYYKIGIAVNDPKKNSWKRLDKKIFSMGTQYKFDNISNEYASVIKIKNMIYLFYNGNEYGKDGIALATSNYNEFRKSI